MIYQLMFTSGSPIRLINRMELTDEQMEEQKLNIGLTSHPDYYKACARPNDFGAYIGLLRSCRKVHDEAVPTLYGKNTFEDEPFPTSLMKGWVQAIGLNVHHLKTVSFRLQHDINHKLLRRNGIYQLRNAKGLESLTIRITFNLCRRTDDLVRHLSQWYICQRAIRKGTKLTPAIDVLKIHRLPSNAPVYARKSEEEEDWIPFENKIRAKLLKLEDLPEPVDGDDAVDAEAREQSCKRLASLK